MNVNVKCKCNQSFVERRLQVANGPLQGMPVKKSLTHNTVNVSESFGQGPYINSHH